MQSQLSTEHAVEPSTVHAQSAQDPHQPEIEQTLEHLVQLVHRPSVTPNDAGCQQYLVRYLTQLGMRCDSFESQGVANLIAKIGQGDTRIAFSGHTDVVAAPNPELWQSDPFTIGIAASCDWLSIADLIRPTGGSWQLAL